MTQDIMKRHYMKDKYVEQGKAPHVSGNPCSSAHEPMFISAQTHVHQKGELTHDFGGLEPKGALARAKKGIGPSQITLLLLTLFFVVGVNRGWGQIERNYTGTYYIASYNDNNYSATSNSKNFYLCPSTVYYDWNGSPANQMPYLTTHKPDQTGRPEEPIAKWKIEYATSIDGVDYYYIKYVSPSGDEKYIVHNEQIVSGNADRVRVHLQSTKSATEDDNLFFFSQGSKGDKRNLNICPKASGRSLNPAKANINNYAGENISGNNPGSFKQGSTTIYCGGLIGYYDSNDVRGLWYLEDIVPTPVVSIDATGKATISSSDATATYYYTTNGTTPTINSTPYSTAISITGVETIKAIAVVNGEVSNVATYTVGSGLSYLIQNQECTAYYMIPGYESGGNVPSNTSSVAGAKMEWLLKNAGAVNGLQYYYFVNKSTGNYLFRTEDNIYVQSSTDRLPTEDGYKFYLRPNADGSYVIYPKDEMTKGLYKNGGNVATDNVALNGTVANSNGQWKFISSDMTDKKPLFEAVPFTLSDASAVHFYFIAGVGTAGSYIVSPTSPSVNAATSKVGTANDKSWMFVKAGEDNWQTYYHIVSAATGEYMYFTGNATSTADLVNAIEMRSLSDTNDIHYQFVLARATTANAYYIIPRTHRDIFNDNKYYSLWNNSSSIKATLNRASNGNDVKWTFEENTTLFCLDPAFDQDGLGNVSITCPTFGTEIYYTMNGDDPTIPAAGVAPSAPTYKYDGAFLPPLGATQIKAKAVIKNDHSITSGVTEYNLSSLAQPTIAFNNTTNTVTISSISGATIYYTYGNTEPSNPSVSESVAHDTSPKTFTINAKTYVKAIAVKGGFTPSAVQSAIIDKVAAPVTDMTSDGKVKLTSNTPGVIIYYEIGDENSVTTPTTSSTRYTSPLENVSGKVIKAIAVKEGWITSDVGGSDETITFQCAMPVIRRGTGNTFTISSSFPSEGVSYYYTTSGGEPTTPYNGPVTISTYPVTVRAIAKAEGYSNSSIAEVTITEDLGQDGDYYLIASAGDFEKFITKANTAAGAGNKYKVTDDFTYSSAFEIAQTFTGTFEGAAKDDGTFCVISGLRKPLFSTTDGAVIKNVMLKNVQISESGNVGAIAGEAGGYTRIYNCGILPDDATNSNPSTVKSTDGYCGSLVGWLKDDSRVINCFSYANITGGTTVGGIVGYNQTASTAKVTSDTYADLRTAVINCMFYGNISGGTNIYPVYGGAKIQNNAETGINNYNFYRAEASFTPSDYNCSWPALEENLTRFEYYRYLLNSNRELCGWWVKSDVTPSTLTTTQVQAIEKDASLMAKWVLDPSLAPYPILKSFGTYPSVINPDAELRIDPKTKAWISRGASSNTIETNKEPDTNGETLGSISVTINAGNHHTANNVVKSFTITAMDISNNDFCYGKIQLPYYNEIFGNPDGTTWSAKYGDNYTDMVVTGWDITSSGGSNRFVENWETGYNFADRKSTDKDSHRVFAQGGYYYVPYGVTSITITAHWANAYYLSNTDRSYERVYMSNASAGKPFNPAGTRSDTFGGQTVSSGSIQSVLSSATKASTVYDCAIVLVGNYQYRNSKTNITDDDSKPFTLMTVDLDFDNEPDYCMEWQVGQGTDRAVINPVRFDFLPIVELGVAMKEDNSKYLYTIGKLTPYGQFEVTETAIIHMGQFEFENENRTIEGPVILNNGLFDQICRGTKSGSGQHIPYFIVGGHIKMTQFTPGAHVRGGVFRHCAVNVLGGEFAKFFLSGNFTANVTANEDNPHCYIDGGKLDFVASGGKEQIDGNVFWKIDHSYIGEFYGGGINSDKPVTGSIDITIDRSKVAKFCGGPQFGDMTSGKTVTTSATGTTFGVYYGAGNGGTCYSQFYSSDFTTGSPDWETDNTTSSGGMSTYAEFTYRNKATGYHAKYELEMINSSAGTENNAVCRTYMYAAQFATTNTGNVTSTLTDCEVEGNFFGGGLLGGVSGNVTSTLKGNTVVKGSAYGAGYGIADLTVNVLPKEGYTAPTRNENTAVITPPAYPTATTYYWTHNTTFGSTTLSTSSPAILNPNGDGKNYLYTEISLDNLGTITGNATLNIQGDTEIYGDVFGGGDKGVVNGSTTVNIE